MCSWRRIVLVAKLEVATLPSVTYSRTGREQKSKVNS